MITFKNIIPGNLWSLPILKAKLHDADVEQLVKASDDSLKENIDWSSELVGEIKSGKQVYFEFPKMFDLAPIASEYARQSFETAGNLKLREAWVVSQYAGDYNPVHAHESDISGIIYLKVPPQISEGFNTASPDGRKCLDGCIHFIFDTYHRPSFRPFGPRAVLPEVGDMYLFPSYILHTVYPFKGEGERRCIAFNLDLI